MAMFQASGVTVVNGRAAADVLISFAVGSGPASTIGRTTPPPVRTDKLGRWAQDGFVEGVDYFVIASAMGVTFRPARSPLTTGQVQVRSEGTVATFDASGVARTPPALINRPGKPPGIPDVRVRFVRVAGRSDVPVPVAVVTGADGTWRQGGFQVGSSFRAVPSKEGLVFDPPSVEISGRASSEFTGSSNMFAVAGRIVTAGGAPEAGVRIAFVRTSDGGTVPADVVSDGSGAFRQAGFARGSRYRVTPSKGSLAFRPSSRDVEFSPTAVSTAMASFQRSTNLVVVGQVLTTAGAGLLSTVIRFDRLAGAGAAPLPVTTTSNGEYRAEGLDAGTTYRVSGMRDGFGVTPAILRATTPGVTTLNLTAFPAFDVAGTVRQFDGGLPTDFREFDAFLSALPPVPGAVVAFHRTDRSVDAPEPVISEADGVFRQRGFEVGGRFVAEATAPGFVGATLVGVGFGGIFGGATSDGGSTTFAHDRSDRLDGLLLLLQTT